MHCYNLMYYADIGGLDRVPNSPQPLMVITSDPIRILYGIFGQSPETHTAVCDQHAKLSSARLSIRDEENRRPTSFPAHRYLRQLVYVHMSLENSSIAT